MSTASAYSIHDTWAVLAVYAVVSRWPLPRPAWTPYLAPYAIGTLAMFWVIDRIGAF